MENNGKNNIYANKVLFSAIFMGMLPLLFILIFYLQNPASPTLNILYQSSQNIPSITSCFNPVMTKIMDLYCKSAPVLAVLLFFVLLKRRRPEKTVNKNHLITACIITPFIYVFYIYFFLCSNFELTTAGRPLRLISGNNFSLLAFYLCLYYTSLLLTYMMCYYPLLVSSLWKQR